FYAPHEAGVDLARADEVEEGAARVDGRDDRAGADLLAAVEGHARGTALFEEDFRHRGVGADADPGSLCRAQDACYHRAHAADGQRLRAGPAADLAGEAIVEAEQRGGRAGPEMAAERGVEGQQAL